jgi:hypothetical protein
VLGPLSVEEALGELRVEELKKLAALISTPVPARKGELVALLARQLEGDRLRGLWERLGELERAAVAEAVHGPERRFHAARFRAKYGRDPDWGSLSRYEVGTAASLLRLFVHRSGFIPADLCDRLGAFVPPPRDASIASDAEPPAALERQVERFNFETRQRECWTETIPLAVHETERAAQYDLLAVLRLIEAGKVAVSAKTRRPAASAIRALAGVLDGGDFYADEQVGPIKAFAWPLLVQAGGLADLAGSRLRLTMAGREALAEPPAPTLRRAWERWCATRMLDELSRVEHIKGQSGKGRRGLTAVGVRRDAVADALAECPVGRWVAVDELFRYMRASGHDFEVTRDAWGLYLCEPHYGSLGYDGYGGWNILQARYALCLLFEYAATLGLIDVACAPPAGAREDFRNLWGADDLPFLSRYDGLALVQLTPLGAYCLGVDDDYEPAPVEPRPVLTVLSNLEIAATGESPASGDRLLLDRYAEPVSDLVWRLAPAALLAAIEQGGSVAELSTFLAARSAAPIPDVAARFLEDVAERAGRLQARGSALLIECDDPALATLVARHGRTRRHCLLAGERHLVVPNGSERAFRAALRELGYAVPGFQERAAA